MASGLFGTIEPRSQRGRVACSVPLPEAELRAGNSNWTKGLQSMSEWVWSANLNPVVFPNNLGRYFLQIPAVFEQQLHYSTTLIFDEPSFKNGVQISGMLPRPLREMVISLIAQRRRCWYSMTHHAILGKLTATRHGMSDEDFAARWSQLDEHRAHAELFSRAELAALDFAAAFATNPKAYSDDQYAELRAALAGENERRHGQQGRWLEQLAAARRARSMGLLRGLEGAALDESSRDAATLAGTRHLSSEANERLVNGQVVELAFVCLQFVALTGVFSALNVHDEDFLATTLKEVVPSPVIAKINQLNEAGGQGMAPTLPPAVPVPLQAILEGRVVVEPAPLQGARVPLVPDEGAPSQGPRDKVMSLLRHHGELARYLPPYSLPVLFDEDTWRNGVHTGGFVTRRLKEVVNQKIFRLQRCRYGIAHHGLLLLDDLLREHGTGTFRPPSMSDADEARARARAQERASTLLTHAHSHRQAPEGVFSALERVAMSWAEELVTRPHEAYRMEQGLRDALDRENRHELYAGLRRLDTSLDGGDVEAAHKRLVDHQLAELAMVMGHVDGLGRVFTLLRLGSEEPVQARQQEGSGSPRALGLSLASTTVGELLVNPRANDRVLEQLQSGETSIFIPATETVRTGEF
ncbi:hypothetical protein D187_007314 [Cystobacter fuscus DSM 2262]|uniref:Uncharacterized protein n=2 Tax=Cystobacter fuscus TaxID=43 RepID=S9QK57_CYSF2|nr:hypothetical protein D187_007314 [Cystobacter fuscus DSM 2262]